RTMDKMKAEGKIGPDWEIFPTAVHSPADKAGADFLLVNKKTGEFHILDATSNPDKLTDPTSKNVASIRQKGIIHFDRTWFDRMGGLRVDDLDAAISSGASGFEKRLSQQLEELTQQASPFKLGETPFPDFRTSDPSATGRQIDEFKA